MSGGVAGLFYKIKAFRTLQLQLVSRSDRSSLPDMLFVFGLEPIRLPVVLVIVIVTFRYDGIFYDYGIQHYLLYSKVPQYNSTDMRRIFCGSLLTPSARRKSPNHVNLSNKC